MVHEPRDSFENRLLTGWTRAGLTADQIAFETSRRYPLSTVEAQRELRDRGIAATDWRIETIAEALKLRQIGGVRLWYADDVDKAAAELEECGKLTIAAMHARNQDITLIELRKREAVADRSASIGEAEAEYLAKLDAAAEVSK